MMKFNLFFFPALLAMLISNGQSIYSCDGSRYVQDVFNDYSITTVQFAENTDEMGVLLPLMADIYEPEDDEAELRPIMIWVFGGSFINGDRTLMAPYCLNYVRKGYVSATVDYRLSAFNIGQIPDTNQAFDVITRAASDIKAAIRYFKSTFHNGNPYRIDPDLVYIGGISSGSISAIQSVVLDGQDEDKLDDWVKEIIEDNGGYEGNTNIELAENFTTDVKGVVNYAGAILDTSWIDADDPVILSIHGTDDQTVKFYEGPAAVTSVEIIDLQGSGLIQLQQDNLEKGGFLIPVNGANHFSLFLDPNFEEIRTNFRNYVFEYFYSDICPEVPVSINEIEFPDLRIFPVPFSDKLHLVNEGNEALLRLQIFDVNGKLIIQEKIIQKVMEIDLSELVSGNYLLKLDGSDASISKLIIKH